jgi:hypothetical protein
LLDLSADRKTGGKVAALSETEKQRYSEIFKYVMILEIDRMKELNLSKRQKTRKADDD